MLRRRQFLVASLALASFLGSCELAKEKEAAELFLDRHYSTLKSRTFDAALADYDDHFFTGVTRNEWRAALVSVVDKLGSFKSYDIISAGIAYKQVAGPGSYLRFQVEVTYSKHVSHEVLYLFRKEGSTKFKIVGHQIDADGLKM